MLDSSRCKISFVFLDFTMATRQEITAIPHLSGYAFGETLGAGSYGINV